jgi:hypothetical protein
MSKPLDFLQEIKDAAQALGIAPTTLCQKAVKNSGLVRRLENGGKITTDTVDEIRAWIAANQPRENVEAAE